MRVFNLDEISYSINADLITYGTEEISSLSEHFSVLLTDEQVQCIKDEWVPLRLRMSKHRNSPTLEFYKDILKSGKFPNISILIEMMMTLSVSTSEVERGFSNMNINKTYLRTQLGQYTLDDLMNVDINGPEHSDFIPDRAIDIWLGAGPGTRHLQHALDAKSSSRSTSSHTQEAVVID